ncbi:MAG: glycosyltransferase, partial [Acidimicrobiales bacterium]
AKGAKGAKGRGGAARAGRPDVAAVIVWDDAAPPTAADVARCRRLLERGDVELVLVDDGGSLETRNALLGLTGGVRILHIPIPAGLEPALSLGVDLAEAPLVVMLSGRATPALDRLEQWLAPLREDDSVELAVPPPADDPAAEVPAGAMAIAARRDKVVQAPGNHDHRGRFAWRPPRLPSTTAPGLNVIGLLDAACGIGEAGRRYAEAAHQAGIPVSTFPYHGHGSPPAPHRPSGGDVLRHDTNLVVLNPDLMLPFAMHAGGETFVGRYVVGMWFWELEGLSPFHHQSLPLVHELWASTEFLRRALAAHTDKPVVHVPMPVPFRSGTPTIPRRAVGLPDRFTFLTTFDFRSLAERKNSLGTVDAFCRAFAPDEGPALVVKTLGSEHDPESWAALRRAVGDRPDVHLLERHLSDDEMSAMIGHAECYVSLHRAEGFGLNPAEAMSWGRPVVATAYSGNLDYMTDDNSYLVPFDLVAVPASLHGIYPAGSRWAEPQLDEAAVVLRRVWEDRDGSTARGLLGQRDIRRTHGPEAAGRAMRRRLAEIDARLGRRANPLRRPPSTAGRARAAV